MKKKEVTKFPKGFFQKERPTITASEALKDVTPINWIEDSKSKTTIKEKNKIVH